MFVDWNIKNNILIISIESSWYWYMLCLSIMVKKRSTVAVAQDIWKPDHNNNDTSFRCIIMMHSLIVHFYSVFNFPRRLLAPDSISVLTKLWDVCCLESFGLIFCDAAESKFLNSEWWYLMPPRWNSNCKIWDCQISNQILLTTQ